MQETPLFRLAQKRDNVKKAPLAQVFTKSWKQILQGTFIMTVSYTFFFLLSTWSLSYGTAVLGFDSREFLMLLMGSIVVFSGMIVYSSILSDRIWPQNSIACRNCSHLRILVCISILFPRTPKRCWNFILLVGWFLSNWSYLWSSWCNAA